MTESTALALAYLLDLIIGDPRWIPHPVRFIGLAIGKFEIYLRERVLNLECDVVAQDMNKGGEARLEPHALLAIFTQIMTVIKRGKDSTIDTYEKMAGILLTVVITGTTFMIFSILELGLSMLTFSKISEYIAFGILVFLISTTLATRELIKSGLAVIIALNQGDIDTARHKLSMIVGRDTEKMDEEGILRATIETLSESASDGIIAPLFYFAIGGLPLAMTYKAVNTLDSMVGYKNDRYLHLGWASARLDDIANYIPSRLTALLIIIAAYIINLFRYIIRGGANIFRSVESKIGLICNKFFGKCEAKINNPDFHACHNAFEVLLSDGKNHTSPNAGMPEAAMSGAVGVRLGGPSFYHGKKIIKPYIGKTHRTMETRTAPAEELYLQAALYCVTVVKVTSFLGFITVLGII